MRLRPLTQIRVLYPAQVGRVEVARGDTGFEAYAPALVAAEHETTGRDHLVSEQRRGGIEQHQVHPPVGGRLERGRESIEVSGVGRVVEHHGDVDIARGALLAPSDRPERVSQDNVGAADQDRPNRVEGLHANEYSGPQRSQRR